ncbi:MAG: HEPN domain-containing protein [Crenarchaeota archaeon]|nr:HEPN domain-containing protein [Thermoproteota archaeon]
MSARDEIILMRRRAIVFLETSKYLAGRGDYDVAAFNAEQAAQLYLKSTLLEIVGDYPRTHSIIFLLRELERIGFDEASQFIKENKSGLHTLEDSYLTSRYFYKSFDKEDAEYLISLVEKVVKLCENIRNRLGKS